MKTTLKELVGKSNEGIYLAILLFFFSACKKDVDLEHDPTSSHKKHRIELKECYDQFAKILSQALNENTDLREFIRENALKQFNRDYDVFYHFVKNEAVGNKTFREVLKDFEQYPYQLDAIENTAPLLTIFIPTLPEGSFSPEKWNSVSEVPLVASELMDSDATIPVFDNGRKVLSLQAHEIPGFPVVVIKTNERVVLKKNDAKVSSIGKKSSADRYVYKSSNFDGSKFSSADMSEKKASASALTSRAAASPTIDPKLVKAFEIFGSTPDYWQRDYIYYDITKSNKNGGIKTNYVETISSIELTRDALDKMMDQPEDPKVLEGDREIYIPEGYSRSNLTGYTQQNAWTDGKFELRISVGINNISGAGAVYDNYFPIEPTEAFYIPFKFQRRPIPGDTRIYITYIRTPSPGRGFSKKIPIDFEVIPWSLEENSPNWKINVVETDASEIRTTVEESTVEFAANFELTPVTKLLEKIGLKFGSSEKETRKSTLTWQKQLDDDDLGNVLVNFGDPIITGKGMSSGYALKSYSNSYYKLTILPKKVF